MKQLNYFLSLLGICILVLHSSLHAQYENVWAFGNGAGLDFNSGSPVAIKTNIKTREGCASLCDERGRLLLYTDGQTAWDRNHKAMPNATNLSGLNVNITSSTTQGAIIVPMPGNPSKYYIFSLGAIETPYSGKLYYSVIDMNLNGGLGDLSPGTSGIFLDGGFTEQMTAVTGNNCDIWLLMVSNSPGDLKAFNINATGVNKTPVISPGAGGSGAMLGSVEVSPDRTKIALGQGNLILMDFDPETGKAKNPIQLFRSNNYYSLCFSPNSSKLYVSNLASLQQFDLSSGDSVKMQASKTLLIQQGYGIKRGPDGKVYVTADGAHLNVIAKPDLPAADCQLIKSGVTLLPGTSHDLGMPNSATIIKNRFLYRSFNDTLACSGKRILEISIPTASNFRWNDRSKGSSIIVDKPGKYWVSYEATSPCMLDYIVDTFIVSPYSNKKYSSTQTKNGKCSADTCILLPTNLLGSNYEWQDGSQKRNFITNKTGIYCVNYTIEASCEDHCDTFIVTYPEKDHKISFTADTLICSINPVQFRNTSHTNFSQFSWSMGDGTTSVLRELQHQYNKAGNYKVILMGNMDGICFDTTYLNIAVDEPIEKLSFLIDRFMACMGDKIEITPLVDTSVRHLFWDFGDGIQLDSPNQSVDHAYDKCGIMSLELKAYFRVCPDLSFKDTLRVSPIPKIDLGTDLYFCPVNGALQLSNSLINEPGNYTWKWSTGDTTESLKVTQHGEYRLALSNEWGCTGTESVKVHKNCYADIPNAFTPNGDGQNDYFFPRQLLTKNITRFHMQIFNRWGQIVYETVNTDGRGWDGKFNEKEQPQDVYIYNIETEVGGTTTQQYKGNVTVLR